MLGDVFSVRVTGVLNEVVGLRSPPPLTNFLWKTLRFYLQHVDISSAYSFCHLVCLIRLPEPGAFTHITILKRSRKHCQEGHKSVTNKPHYHLPPVFPGSAS